MAFMVDRTEVGWIIRSAVGQRDDVIDLVRLTKATKSGAFITSAEVLVSLQDLVAQSAPWAAATIRRLAGRKRLGLISMLGTVAVAIAVQGATAFGPARALRSQRHGVPSR